MAACCVNATLGHIKKKKKIRWVYSRVFKTWIKPNPAKHILEEVSILGLKLVETPMNPNVKLHMDQ